MSRYSRWTRGRALALAVAAGYAVAACGGAADSTGPGDGNGNTPAANDLFVSATTGNDAGGGTQQQPFRTIAAALAASDSGQTIRVAGGMYAERVVLKSHVRIVGGYDPASWQRDTVHDSTTIGDSVMTVVGLHVSDVVLDGLHLRNLAGSVYGVVTFDSSAGIEIVGSTISAPRGFPGRDGFLWGNTRPAQAADGSPGADGGGCVSRQSRGRGRNRDVGWELRREWRRGFTWRWHGRDARTTVTHRRRRCGRNGWVWARGRFGWGVSLRDSATGLCRCWRQFGTRGVLHHRRILRVGWSLRRT